MNHNDGIKICSIDDRNIFRNIFPINRKHREFLHKHRSMVLWFTGLSGSGKSMLAGVVEEELHLKLINTYILDGDNIRHGLCNDLKFSVRDRRENIRRSGETAKLMVDAGLVVLATFVSPSCSDRKMVRDMFSTGDFFEIFVDTPLHICEQRDPKGLYKKARIGLVKYFTGINVPYEVPEQPDLHLDGTKSVKELLHQLLDMIFSKVYIIM